jgi:ATP-binding cassette subfamily F protein uup
LLVGELQPGSGEILTGAGVRIAYFDQHRARLDETASVADNVSNGAEHVAVDGGSRHVISYLQDFLFTPDRARSPVNVLSGGERARLLLARLFAKPSNVLVMDEPTNDLDVETLELLEERLTDYPGSLLLVSHDRAFLDNVVTSTLVLEGHRRVGEYVGGYSDWLRQRATRAEPGESTDRPARDKREKPSKATPRLSYKQKRELESLPERTGALQEGRIRNRRPAGVAFPGAIGAGGGLRALERAGGVGTEGLERVQIDGLVDHTGSFLRL